MFVFQFFQDGKDHIRIDGARPVSQQQCGMHYFTHLTRFNNQGCLYPFLYGDQMVMNCADGEEGRDRCQLFIDIFITQGDVIHSIGNGLFRFFA